MWPRKDNLAAAWGCPLSRLTAHGHAPGSSGGRWAARCEGCQCARVEQKRKVGSCRGWALHQVASSIERWQPLIFEAYTSHHTQHTGPPSEPGPGVQSQVFLPSTKQCGRGRSCCGFQNDHIMLKGTRTLSPGDTEANTKSQLLQGPAINWWVWVPCDVCSEKRQPGACRWGRKDTQGEPAGQLGSLGRSGSPNPRFPPCCLSVQ